MKKDIIVNSVRVNNKKLCNKNNIIFIIYKYIIKSISKRVYKYYMDKCYSIFSSLLLIKN